jgi:predicted dehydrogenase
MTSMKKEDRLLRIGILGCGPIAQFAHFDACRKARNAELYAICDVAEDLVGKMAAIHEPRVTYKNYDQMLADPEVEAIILAASDQYHVPLSMKAIEAGKHVLVEKPLGVNVEECELLGDRMRRADGGLVLQIGNNRRFDPGIAFARQFMEEELGQRIGFKAWYYDSSYRYTMTDNLQPIPVASKQAKRPAENPKADKQRYFMLTHGSHLMDTARFLGGPIASIRARHLKRAGTFCWFIDVDFADGSLGHLDLTIAVRGDFEEGFQIYGQHGSVTGKVFLPWYHKSSIVECFSVKDRQFRRPLGEDAYTYKLQIEGFADTILQGAPLRGAGIEDGVAAMRAMVAIARSVESHSAVNLADVTGGV